MEKQKIEKIISAWAEEQNAAETGKPAPVKPEKEKPKASIHGVISAWVAENKHNS